MDLVVVGLIWWALVFVFAHIADRINLHPVLGWFGYLGTIALALEIGKHL